MSMQSLMELVQYKIKSAAHKYLTKKQDSKGREIKYSSLNMENYLTPNYFNITIKDKKLMFAIRNRMIKIYSNFPDMKLNPLCICYLPISQEHIYYCEIINTRKYDVPYSCIFSTNRDLQMKGFLRMKQCLENRKILLNLNP